MCSQAEADLRLRHVHMVLLKGLRMSLYALRRSGARRVVPWSKPKHNPITPDLHNTQEPILNPFYSMECKTIKKIRQNTWIEAEIPRMNPTPNRYNAHCLRQQWHHNHSQLHNVANDYHGNTKIHCECAWMGPKSFRNNRTYLQVKARQALLHGIKYMEVDRTNEVHTVKNWKYPLREPS